MAQNTLSTDNMKLKKPSFLFVLFIAMLIYFYVEDIKSKQISALEKGYLELSLYESDYMNFISLVRNLEFNDYTHTYSLAPTARDSLDVILSFGKDSISMIRYDSTISANEIIKFTSKHDIYKVRVNNAIEGVISINFSYKMHDKFIWLIYHENKIEDIFLSFKDHIVVDKAIIGEKYREENEKYLYDKNWMILTNKKIHLRTITY